MNFRPDIIRIAALGALAAALVLPSSALAEYYVPPGNSAANQYTESLPSAGGESTGKGGGGTSAPTKPAKSLGARNAHRLEAQGPAGKATAEVAAETAPPAILQPTGSTAPAQGHSAGQQHPGSGKPSQGQPAGGGAGSTGEATHVNQPSGSSAIGEVVAQATGSADDGNLGLWLPIAILLTVAGSIAYRLRPRHGPTA
jgi:hypothetical protein